MAIVTGAGSGIGQAVSVMLAAEGYQLVLVGRDAKKLAGTVAEIRQQLRDADPLVVPVDINRDGAAGGVIEQTLGRFGSVDVLINNAATLIVGPIAAIDARALNETFATNTFAPALLVSRAWGSFVKQGGGRVINISSMATVDPFPGLAVYAASKAALESLTRSVAKEGKTHGIRAWAVAPGAVETAMLRRVASKEALPPERTLSPEAVARVILECVDGRRDAESGQTIHVASP